jgi:hypothetical protein
MKELPKQLSKEVFINIDYLICRFMNSKIAYKINQNQKGTWFTCKKIKEEGLHPQYQFHIRFNGMDKWNNKEDIIDFDFYIDESNMDKIKQIKGNPNANQPTNNNI